MKIKPLASFITKILKICPPSPHIWGYLALSISPPPIIIDLFPYSSLGDREALRKTKQKNISFYFQKFYLDNRLFDLLSKLANVAVLAF